MTYSSEELRHALRVWWRKRREQLALLCIVILLATVFFERWQNIENKFLDLTQSRLFFALRGPVAPPEDIVILSHDDISQHKLGLEIAASGVPRAMIATQLELLIEAEPRLVVLDQSMDANKLGDPEANARLIAALRKLPATISRGLVPFGASTKDEEMLIHGDSASQDAAMARDMYLDAEPGKGITGVAWFLGKPRRENADEDTHFPMIKPLRELGGYTVSTPSPYSLINFYGPALTIKTVPLYKLLLTEHREATLTELKDKVILVGLQRLMKEIDRVSSKDEFEIAGSFKPMFGVEIWANVVGNHIRGDYIRRLRISQEGVVLFFVSALAFSALLMMSGVLRFIISLAVVFSYSSLSYFVFVKYNLFLPGVIQLWLAIGFAAFIAAVVETIRAWKRRVTLDELFQAPSKKS